jgi:hypothetical protein
MYEKDKKTRITLRLTDEQFSFIKGETDLLGVSPSEYLRILVNSTMAVARLANEKMKGQKGERRENEKTNCNN